MNVENDPQRNLVPLEAIARKTQEADDKATRKMVNLLRQTLSARFPIEVEGNGLEYNTLRSVIIRSCGPENTQARVSIRVKGKEYQLPAEKPVVIISGMCMFGASGLMGVTESGQRVSLTDPETVKNGVSERIVKIVETPLLHISEFDTIQRVVNGLRVLSGSMQQNGTLTSTEGIFHLPVPEYMLYMNAFSDEGAISPLQYQLLVGKIQRRAQDLQKNVNKRSSIAMKFGSPLANLMPLLQEKRERTTLQDCIKVLQGDQLFSQLLNVKPPGSFIELAQLSYAAGYIIAEQTAAQLGGGCLAVDIVEENPILNEAEQLCEAMGRPFNMAALLIANSTLTLTGRNGKQAPFMHNESEKESRLAELRRVFKIMKGRQL